MHPQSLHRISLLVLIAMLLQALALPATGLARRADAAPQRGNAGLTTSQQSSSSSAARADALQHDRIRAAFPPPAPALIAPMSSTPASGAPTTQASSLYLPLLQQGGAVVTGHLTARGGQISSADGNVTLIAHAGATDEDLWVTLRVGGEHPAVDASRDTGSFFDLTARTADGRLVTRFASPLGLRVRYRDGATSTSTQHRLFFYGTERSRWAMLPSSDDSAAGILTATTDRIATFAVFSSPSSGCDITPGQGASASIAAAFASTYANQGGEDILGCATGVVYDWDGAPAQDFEDASTIVYNSQRGKAYYTDFAYWFGYVQAGGPGGFLGLPIQNSTDAGDPPAYYKDYTSDFTGTPIQLYQYGFVGYDNEGGGWQGARHYPLACDVSVSVLQIFVPGVPTEDEPDPPPIEQKKVSVRVGGIADPGRPYGDASFSKAVIGIIDATTGWEDFVRMAAEGDHFTYETPALFDPTDVLRFSADAYRQIDNRVGFAPKTWYVGHDEYRVPDGYGYFTLSSCNGAPLPGGGGGGGYIPPSDTTPPVIAQPTLVKDGAGNLSVRVKVTDNRAVAIVTLNIDGENIMMLPRGGDMYEAVKYGLRVGSHKFAIRAVDTSGNTARLPADDNAFFTFKIERSNSYGQVDYQGYSPDPVNTLIGNYAYRYRDLAISGPGPDLAIERFYNGQSSAIGLFGLGWTTLYDMRVTAVDTLLLSGAQLRYADGRVVNFPSAGDGFGHAPTVFDTLAREGGGYLLTRTDQTRYHFDDQGRLTRVDDPSGNALVLTYSGDRLARVDGSGGRALSFSSDGDGRVTRVDAPGGVSLSYAYGADGQMTTFTDGTGVTVTYRYDAEHGMVGLQTPQGHDFLAEQTFDEQGRVLFQRVGDQFVNRFAYDDATNTTIISDTYDHPITYRYDDKGRLIEQRDALGYSEQWTYNADNQRTSYTDRNGHTTRYEYNAQGDLIKQIDALGNATTSTYDGEHHLLAQTDALGRTTRYEYDALGRRTAIVDALGGRTTMRYDDQGQLVEQIGARGGHTTYAYDASGNLVEMRDALGNTTRYEYDALGRRVKQIDANGNATTFTYDSNGNLLTQTDALGHSTSYSYDANNNRVAETDPNGHTTRYSYSHLDNLLTTTAPDGGVTTIGYDDLNHRVAETDPLGHTQRWGLDATYRVISETDALGNTTRYEYDAQGNRVAVTNPRGFTTRYEYDALNRVVAVSDALGGVTRYAYDAVGNRISETDANGATTSYVYDALNRVVEQTDALGNVTRFSYDAEGNRVGTHDPAGYATSRAYDALSRVIAETDALSNTTRYEYDAVGNKTATIDALDNATRYAYDAANRMVSQTDALGGVTRYEYDAAGNQTAVINALGNATGSTYDANNRRTIVTDALGGQERSDYDLAGRRVRLVDANGHATSYSYDALGRTVVISDPLGFAEQYAFDAAGNQVSVTDKNGNTTRSEYDALNRLTAQTNALGFTTRFAYDAVGNQLTRTDALGNVTTSTYDALSRKIADRNALGFTTRYEYDRLGRLIRTIFADGSTTMRAYDADGRLVTETDGEGYNRLYGYDAVGNQTRVTDANGATTTFSYDALRRQIRAEDRLGVVGESAYDALGNLVATTDGNGHTTRMAYDALRRQVLLTDAEGNQTRSDYDAVGNRVAVTDGNGHTTRSSYDARNQLIAVTDALGNATRYAYDGMGQQIAETDALGIVKASSYDAVGQLIAVTLNARPGQAADAQTNVTTRYRYDAVGNRTSIGDPNGHVVTFQPDALGQLVAEADALGNTTRYTYDALGRQVRRDNPNGTFVASAYDRNGSLVRTDASDGAVVRRSYDGNRNLLELSDSSGRTRRAYDARNRLLSEESARGRVAYGYDGANNRTSISYADGKQVRYSYFANNWLRGVLNPDGAATTYERDGIGQVLRQHNGNSTLTTQQYDAADHLLLVATVQIGSGDHLITRASYQYDAVGQRTQATLEDRTGQPKIVTETYTQDALRRLIGTSDSAGVRTSYRYDAAGNRTAWQSNDDSRTPRPFDALDIAYSYDAADQLTRADDRAAQVQIGYRYDANGDRVEQRIDRFGTAYRYDAEDRLVAVQQFQVNGSGQRHDHEIATMAYDGDGRRVAKSEDHQVGGGGVQTTSYLYDGLDPIASYETWHPQHDNLYRADSGRILTLDRDSGGSPGQTYWYAQDALGSTMALAQDKGQGAHAYRYDAFGAIIPDTAGAFGPHNPYTFSGQEYDDFIGLYHFHARAYDPDTGTWLTRDPFRGSPDDPQSLHRYGYVKGNPVNLVDAYGYAAQGGTYGKGSSCQFGNWIWQTRFGRFVSSLMGLVDPGDIKDDLSKIDCSVDLKISDIKAIFGKHNIKNYTHHSLLPDWLAHKLILGKFYVYADLYTDYEFNPIEGVALSYNTNDNWTLSACANAYAKLEIGATFPLSGIVSLDVYGGAGLESEFCLDINQKQGLSLRGEASLYGEIGARIYAAFDIGIAGFRAGFRGAARLRGTLSSKKEDRGFETELEVAPFYGYKYFNFWKQEWKDQDLAVISTSFPMFN